MLILITVVLMGGQPACAPRVSYGATYQATTYGATTYGQAAVAAPAYVDPVLTVGAYLRQEHADREAAAALAATTSRLDRIEALLTRPPAPHVIQVQAPAPAPVAQPMPMPPPQPTATPQYAMPYQAPYQQPMPPPKSPPAVQYPMPMPAQQGQPSQAFGAAPPPPPVPSKSPADFFGFGQPQVSQAQQAQGDDRAALVIRTRCGGCHAGDARKGAGIKLLEADGTLAAFAPAVMLMAQQDVRSGKMPKGGEPLPADEVAAIDDLVANHSSEVSAFLMSVANR